MSPGATALQRMPWTPCMFATCRVNASNAAFEHAYARWFSSPSSPDSELVLTIAPRPPDSITGIACLQTSMAPRRLTAMVRSHTSTSMSTTSPSRPSTSRPRAAALLCTMSMRPHRSTTDPTMRRTDCSSLTSTATAIAASPSSLATVEARSCAMSAIATRAPSSTMRLAVANPRPEEAPVTMATRSCNVLMRDLSEKPERTDRASGTAGYRQRGDDQAADRRRVGGRGTRRGTELAVVDQQQADGPYQAMHAHEGLRRMAGVEEIPTQ